MPTYTIEDKNTGEQEEMFMSISEMLIYFDDNPNKRQVIGSPMIVSGVASARMKPDHGFRDVLKKIKSKHRRSTINTW
jgi:hypothetical protein